jgi:hypothetical protein
MPITDFINLPSTVYDNTSKRKAAIALSEISKFGLWRYAPGMPSTFEYADPNYIRFLLAIELVVPRWHASTFKFQPRTTAFDRRARLSYKYS